MDYALGVLLFALGIAASIALHEAGHMGAARAFGMRVRRYFIGFGPTVWSMQKGHTEYGLKAVPFGGFCDIAGMTALDAYTEDEKPYLMVDRPGWQRIVVMLAGIAVNIVLGMAIIFGVALVWGLPTTDDPGKAIVGETVCTPTTIAAAEANDGYGQCDGVGPAAESGMLIGDRVTAVNGVDVENFPDMVTKIKSVGAQAAAKGAHAGDRVTVPAVVERDGQSISLNLQVQVVERLNESKEAELTGAIGMRRKTMEHYNPWSAIGGSANYSWYVVKQTGKALVDLPQRYWPVVESIFGGDRANDSPVSVVGASRAGGELVDHEEWMAFLLLLANLNFFLAAFNLVPLPPMDGGHAVVVMYEKIRDWFRRRRGLDSAGPADYTRLLPVTYAVAALLLVFGLTVVVADVVNPVRLF